MNEIRAIKSVGYSLWGCYKYIVLGALCSWLSLQPFAKITIFSDTVSEGNGPFEVYSNTIKGLQLLHIPFNVNPVDNQVANIVLVLSGVHYFAKAIQWKGDGKISYLLGGPNLMNSPKEYNYMFAKKEVDACLVPSEWIQVAYHEDAPALKGRVYCWYTGVDVLKWIPDDTVRDAVLIYWKTEHEDFCQSVVNIIKKYGYNPICIRYNYYRNNDYKNVLRRSQFAIFITRSESQGIALAEAWSMNVPTLVFDPGRLTYRGRRYSVVSSCPYLTQSTGRTWKTFQELERLITQYDIIAKDFCPRAWVLQHMSLQSSIEQLLGIIEQLQRIS